MRESADERMCVSVQLLAHVRRRGRRGVEEEVGGFVCSGGFSAAPAPTEKSAKRGGEWEERDKNKPNRKAQGKKVRRGQVVGR